MAKSFIMIQPPNTEHPPIFYLEHEGVTDHRREPLEDTSTLYVSTSADIVGQKHAEWYEENLTEANTRETGPRWFATKGPFCRLRSPTGHVYGVFAPAEAIVDAIEKGMPLIAFWVAILEYMPPLEFDPLAHKAQAEAA